MILLVLLLFPDLRFSLAIALLHLQNRGMVHQAIDSCSSGHWIFEDGLPLREDEIAGDNHTACFIAFGKQNE